MDKDSRIELIKEQILRFAASEYDKKLPVSKKKDDLDAIIAGLNVLGEQLQDTKEYQADKDYRKNQLMEILLKYTVLDFSEQASVSERKDEIDAIAAGLNAMSEEIIHYQKELDRRTNQLEHTNNELESFTYSVSHDLRAPLRAVHGYSQILLEDFGDSLDKEGKRVLNNIMKNAKKMGILIDNLLSYSRMGKRELNRVQLNPTKLAQNIVLQLKESEPINAEIIVHDMHAVNADYTLLSLVYQNLISNAIKYSSKKKNPVIEIGDTDFNGKKVYYVSDNGAGFDMAYYDKLFGVFQRLHRDEEFEGTGVGLAIVYKIITKHGGTIWAESKIGKGATFYFTIT